MIAAMPRRSAIQWKRHRSGRADQPSGRCRAGEGLAWRLEPHWLFCWSRCRGHFLFSSRTSSASFRKRRNSSACRGSCKAVRHGQQGPADHNTRDGLGADPPMSVRFTNRSFTRSWSSPYSLLAAVSRFRGRSSLS